MALSGKNGAVTYGSAGLQVRGWTLEQDPTLHKYASSQTSAHKQNLAGVMDWTARVRLYVDDFVAAAIAAGSAVAVTLTMDSGKTLTGNGVTGPVNYDVDVEEGSPIECELTIAAGGALT